MYEPIEKDDNNPIQRKGDTFYSIDDILDSFGKPGKFQMKLLLIATLLGLINCWRILFDLFAVKHCPWKCTSLGLSLNCTDSDLAGVLPCDIPGNAALDMAGDAEGKYWQYDVIQSKNSIVSTYGLPCSETWKFSFTSSIFFIGSLIGVWAFGHISDMIGRSKSVLIGLVLCVVSNWIIPFITNINIYLACRFFDGAAYGGYFMIIFVLVMEYSSPNQRALIGTMIVFLEGLGMATIAVYGYLFRSLAYYSIALAIPPSLAIVIVFFFLPESPRWLLGKGRDEEALTLLQAVAETNGCKMPENVQLRNEAGVAGGLKDVLKNRKLMSCTLINMFGSFMTSLLFYTLWFGAQYLSGNIYLNALLLGLAEIPGRLSAYFFMEKLGRKHTFMIFLSLGSIMMLSLIYDDATFRKVMYCFGKTVTGLLWVVVFLYTAEIYPTNVRGLGSGVGWGAARIAAMIAPFFGEISKFGTYVPYVIVASLALACLSVFWMLPETKGKDLPQTLEDFENLFAKDSKYDHENITMENCA